MSAQERSAAAQLRDFIKQELRGDLDLRGEAAAEAAYTLLSNWTCAVMDGSLDNLVPDVDLVVSKLRLFQDRARELLPIVNGGLDGKSVDYWQDRLNNEDISVYEAEDLPGHWGFTGCEADCYQSELEALAAAVQHCWPNG